MTTRIFLTDDHSIFRTGLRALIENEEDMLVVGEAGDGSSAVRMCKELNPDVVIMDISMPDISGVEATRQILKSKPHIKVIALSMFMDKNFTAEMLEAGASGYLPKECVYEELIEAIKWTMSGKKYLSPRITGTVITEYLTAKEKADLVEDSKPTAKEREIIRMIAEEKRQKEMARALNVSVLTVKTHIRKIKEKLKIKTTVGLVKYAIKNKLIEIDEK